VVKIFVKSNNIMLLYTSESPPALVVVADKRENFITHGPKKVW
jgi:hypothetical protein